MQFALQNAYNLTRQCKHIYEYQDLYYGDISLIRPSVLLIVRSFVSGTASGFINIWHMVCLISVTRDGIQTIA